MFGMRLERMTQRGFQGGRENDTSDVALEPVPELLTYEVNAGCTMYKSKVASYILGDKVDKANALRCNVWGMAAVMWLWALDVGCRGWPVFVF